MKIDAIAGITGNYVNFGKSETVTNNFIPSYKDYAPCDMAFISSPNEDEYTPKKQPVPVAKKNNKMDIKKLVTLIMLTLTPLGGTGKADAQENKVSYVDPQNVNTASASEKQYNFPTKLEVGKDARFTDETDTVIVRLTNCKKSEGKDVFHSADFFFGNGWCGGEILRFNWDNNNTGEGTYIDVESGWSEELVRITKDDGPACAAAIDAFTDAFLSEKNEAFGNIEFTMK